MQLKQDWKPGMKLQEVLELVAKVLIKTMDSATPNAEKLEFGVVKMTPQGPKFELIKDEVINKLMADAAPKEGEEGAAASSTTG